MRVFLSAGEPSGDHHAALLVRSLRRLRPDVECVGLGGPQMAAEGCQLVADLTRLAVMWFLRVVLSLHSFVDLARRAERSFLDCRPDVCVLVDFPGFHWWLAWRAKRHGIPVVFYCPPQIWAWASWRKKKMRRLIDHVLSPLPFEHQWFLANGIDSTLVGHPFFDEHGADQAVAPSPQRQETAAGPLVLLLPGSRGQEITANLPTLLRAAVAVRSRVPEARFVVAVLHDRHAAVVRGALAGENALHVDVAPGKARSLMQEADCAVAVSGSVSLELLAARVPAVVVYRIGSLAYVVQSWCRHARFITLVNLLAVKEPILPVRGVWRPPTAVAPADPEAVYPEYLVVQDPAEQVAGHLVEWLCSASARERVVTRLNEIARQVARGGSADRAAAAVLAIAAGRHPTAAPDDIHTRRAA
ncbi:MAG: lipid-A-disaccharide synthase [Planctomycetota bacterium]|nr:MAG: lipid-A-disaccharide synthase [Planctomycetota bacterium]